MQNIKVSAETKYTDQGQQTEVKVTGADTTTNRPGPAIPLVLAVASSKNGAPPAEVANECLAQLRAIIESAERQMVTMGLVPNVAGRLGAPMAPPMQNVPPLATRPFPSIGSGMSARQAAMSANFGHPPMQTVNDAPGFPGRVPAGPIALTAAEMGVEVEAIAQLRKALQLDTDLPQPTHVLASLKLLATAIEKSITTGIEHGSEMHKRIENIVALIRPSRPFERQVSEMMNPGTTPAKNTTATITLEKPFGMQGYPYTARPSYPGRTSPNAALAEHATIGEMVKATTAENQSANAIVLAYRIQEVLTGSRRGAKVELGTAEQQAIVDTLFYAAGRLVKIDRETGASAAEFSRLTQAEAVRLLEEQRQALVKLRGQTNEAEERARLAAKERDERVRAAEGACQRMRIERDTHMSEKRTLAGIVNRLEAALQAAQKGLADVTAQLKAQTDDSMAKARELNALKSGGITGMGEKVADSIRKHPFRDQYSQRVQSYRRTDDNGHLLTTEVAIDIPPPGTKVVWRGENSRVELIDQPFKTGDVVEFRAGHRGRVGETRGRVVGGCHEDGWRLAMDHGPALDKVPSDRIEKAKVIQTYKAGDRVRISAIVCNGQIGTVTGWSNDFTDYRIAMPDGSQRTFGTAMLKPVNTRTLTGLAHWQIPANARNKRQGWDGTWSCEVDEG